MHHWAHLGRRNCDPWWENETAWHRNWKNRFPEHCREICHTAPDGEIHIADIKTPTGIVIEVQHSGMTDAERLSRESFYGNLVWVVDGSAFRENFDILCMLPDPTSEIAQDVVWWKATRRAEAYFWRPSENPEATNAANSTMVRIHSVREIEEDISRAYRGHCQYRWVRPRKMWLETMSPVYIDFGGDVLAKLETYDRYGLLCIRFVSKERFVHDAMFEESAQAIATRFANAESAEQEIRQLALTAPPRALSLSPVEETIPSLDHSPSINVDDDIPF